MVRASGQPFERMTSAALPVKAANSDLALDIVGEMARQGRFAGSGIAEQSKQLRGVRRGEPSRDGLERLILRRGPRCHEKRAPFDLRKKRQGGAADGAAQGAARAKPTRAWNPLGSLARQPHE